MVTLGRRLSTSANVASPNCSISSRPTTILAAVETRRSSVSPRRPVTSTRFRLGAGFARPGAGAGAGLGAGVGAGLAGGGAAASGGLSGAARRAGAASGFDGGSGVAWARTGTATAHQTHPASAAHARPRRAGPQADAAPRARRRGGAERVTWGPSRGAADKGCGTGSSRRCSFGRVGRTGRAAPGLRPRRTATPQDPAAQTAATPGGVRRATALAGGRRH